MVGFFVFFFFSFTVKILFFFSYLDNSFNSNKGSFWSQANHISHVLSICIFSIVSHLFQHILSSFSLVSDFLANGNLDSETILVFVAGRVIFL